MKKSLFIILTVLSAHAFATVQSVSDDQFKSTIASGVVVVDFYSTWCGPCKKLAPVLDKISNDMNGKVTFAKVDTGQTTIGKQLGVSSLPTVIIYKDGKEVNRFVGFKDEGSIRSLLSQYGS